MTRGISSATPRRPASLACLYDGSIAIVERSGVSVLGSQPVQSNIRSGLPTIEEKALTEGGDRLENVIDRTVNGRLTCVEALGYREFALTRLHLSA